MSRRKAKKKLDRLFRFNDKMQGLSNGNHVGSRALLRAWIQEGDARLRTQKGPM